MRPTHYPTEPPHLWNHFLEISAIPRPSGGEEAISRYIVQQAEQCGHPWQTDSAGNLLVQVPASEGMSGCEIVTIQNHLDMVTVKSSDKKHDFERDPLSLQVEDGWLRADRTTLGADNGLGCAAALALMTETGLAHPPLDLLFTVDEESGLHGALDLDPALLRSSRMLNLDTEDWQELFVGCAGAGGWQMRRNFDASPAPADCVHRCLTIGGLAGGHSGIQIHEQLGNALKLLAQALADVPALQLAAADVGVAHNVIPREGDITFACPVASEEQLQRGLQAFVGLARSYLPAADQAISLQLRESEPVPVLSVDDSALVLDAVAAFPHGALAYSPQSPADLVELSANLAVMRLTDGEFLLETSYRFFSEAQSVPLQQSILSVARAFGLSVEPLVGYPGWQPDFDSALLNQAQALYETLFGAVPQVKAIHAGLECGILKSKRTDLDILSFGPTIRGAHSPSERLRIDTVEPFWHFLTALLARM